MPDSSPQQRFRDLLSRLLEDDISEADLRELTSMVKESPAFASELRLQLQMDSRLSQFENESHEAERFVGSVLASLDAEDDGDVFVDRVLSGAKRLRSPSPSARLPWMIAAASLAASFVLSLFWMGRSEFASPDVVDPGVAVISNLVGELTLDGETPKAGDPVGKGLLELKSGYLRLEFYRGAEVSLAGPARLELVDAQRVICHLGKIRANVPPVARGFTVVTPDSEVVDLGTEFAVEVGEKGQTEIHVFDGEVEAFDSARSPESKTLLTAGSGMKIRSKDRWEEIPAESERFQDLADLEKLEADVETKRFAAWELIHETTRRDPRLVAYYDFQRDPQQRRTLRNRASSGSELDGAIVGARWVSGPWPGKRALGFKRPSDRVRIHLPGEYESLTLSAWVRVDGLDRSHSSLLLTDGYDPGEVHWQFRHDGFLILGMRHSDKSGQNYLSHEFMNLTQLGHWFHLTTVVDRNQNTVSHYLDGELSAVHKLKKGHAIRLGDCSIGNWDEPKEGAGTPIRNLNGRIAELMVFGAALTESEIRRLALRED